MMPVTSRGWRRTARVVLWLCISLSGAGALGAIAIQRNEERVRLAAGTVELKFLPFLE